MSTVAAIQADIYKGTLLAPIWAKEIDPLKLAGCDWVKLAKLKAILNDWEVGQSAAAAYIASYKLAST
ncbi:MAG: hypothetical protein IPL47_16295 [Phyllobacteriaceae bacterium]|nr:hypothetical protein [Phyllobacteriaceae bacterium]